MRTITRCLLISLCCAAVFAVSPFLSASVATTLPLARDGQPCAVLVLSDAPSNAAREGAAILGDHLSQICGGRFGTVSEKDLTDLEVKDGRLVAPDREANRRRISSWSAKVSWLAYWVQHRKALVPVAYGFAPIRTLWFCWDRTTKRHPIRMARAMRLPCSWNRLLGCRYLWPGEEGKVVPESQDH